MRFNIWTNRQTLSHSPKFTWSGKYGRILAMMTSSTGRISRMVGRKSACEETELPDGVTMPEIELPDGVMMK